jgi:hypothetical protein
MTNKPGVATTRFGGFSFKSSPSHRLANALGQLSGRRASGPAEDARASLRQVYDAEVDLFPDAQNKTLTVRLHHLTQAAHDEPVRHLCDEPNATVTLLPGRDLDTGDAWGAVIPAKAGIHTPTMALSLCTTPPGLEFLGASEPNPPLDSRFRGNDGLDSPAREINFPQMTPGPGPAPHLQSRLMLISLGVRRSEVMPGKCVPRQPVLGKMRYKEVYGCSLRTLAQLIPAA